MEMEDFVRFLVINDNKIALHIKEKNPIYFENLIKNLTLILLNKK